MKQHNVLRTHLHLKGELFIVTDIQLLHTDLRDASFSEVAHIVRSEILRELKVLPLIENAAGLRRKNPSLHDVISLLRYACKAKKEYFRWLSIEMQNRQIRPVIGFDGILSCIKRHKMTAKQIIVPTLRTSQDIAFSGRY